jgi:glycosyltransferase involved in cell wall biosynthesis
MPFQFKSVGPKQRVAYVVFQIGAKSDGGVESVTQIMSGLDGYEKIVITQKNTSTVGRWRDFMDAVHVIDLRFKLGSPYLGTTCLQAIANFVNILRFNLRAWSILRKWPANVVHINDPYALVFSGIGAKISGARILLNIRSTKTRGAKYGKGWNLLARIPDATVCLSHEMKAVLSRDLPGLMRHGRPAEGIGVVHSSVDLQKFRGIGANERRQIRKSLGLELDGSVVGIVGVFSERKQQLRVIAEICPHFESEDEVTLLLAGDPDPRDREYFERCVNAAGDERLNCRFQFLGFREDIERVYQACDVVLIASTCEGLARCMIESLACEIPVVSFDVSSASEILEKNECGLVVRGQDFGSMTRQVGALLADDLKRSKMGRNGRATAERLFHPDKCIESYRLIYDGLAEETASR